MSSVWHFSQLKRTRPENINIKKNGILDKSQRKFILQQMKIRWRISLSVLVGSLWGRVHRCVGADVVSFRVKPATDSRFASASSCSWSWTWRLELALKLKLGAAAEFEFSAEHLNAADLISVTRRPGRRRRRRRRETCPTHTRQRQSCRSSGACAVASDRFIFVVFLFVQFFYFFFCARAVFIALGDRVHDVAC